MYCYYCPTVAMSIPKHVAYSCSLGTETYLYCLMKSGVGRLQSALAMPVLHAAKTCQNSINLIAWLSTEAIPGYKICFIIYSRWRPFFLHNDNKKVLHYKCIISYYIISYPSFSYAGNNLATVLPFITLTRHVQSCFSFSK